MNPPLAGPLSSRALVGIARYKYKASGYTWLDEAHNGLWEWAVSHLPMWLAPNLITLTASCAILAAYAINVYHNPGFTGEAPTWVYLFTAWSVVFYINLDCMDGKQARRTGSSSPLGQLFDHGCDALVLHLMLGNIAASLGVACSWRMAAGCMGIMMPWIMAQWEEYHTGVMMYGTKYYGVLEANYSIALTHLITAAGGAALWRIQLPLGQLGQLLVADGQATPIVTVADAALVAVSAAGIGQGAMNVVRVFSGARVHLSEHDRGNKHVSRGTAAAQLALLLAACWLGAWSVAVASAGPGAGPAVWGAGAWARVRPAWLGASDAQDGALHCRAAFNTMGFVYALVATKLIVAHMAKEPMALCPSVLLLATPVANTWGVKLLPDALTAGAGGAVYLVPPLPLQCMLLAAALVVHIGYARGLVAQLCSFLSIKCFVIARKRDA